MNTFATSASRDQDGAASKRYIRCTDPKRVMNYLNKRQIRVGRAATLGPSQARSTAVKKCHPGTCQIPVLDVCAAWHLLTPSYGYSPRCGGRYREQGGHPGSQQVVRLPPLFASGLIARRCDAVTVQPGRWAFGVIGHPDTYSRRVAEMRTTHPQRRGACRRVPRSARRPADGELKISCDYGLNGLTANWMTRYGVPPRGVVFHWLTNTRSSSSVEPGEMYPP